MKIYIFSVNVMYINLLTFELDSYVSWCSLISQALVNMQISF
jgi:hypothetical protein